MIRRIILSIVLLFLLVALAITAATLRVIRSSADLRTLVELHEVSEMRQDLRLQFQKTQKALYAYETVFEPDLNEVVSTIQDINLGIELCHGCHHSESIAAQIDELEGLTRDYEQLYSEFITGRGVTPRRQELQIEASTIGERVLDHVDGMSSGASAKLRQRTAKVLEQVEVSRKVVAVSLPLVLVLAVVIGRFLALGVTRPVGRLLLATKKVSSGEFGYHAVHRERGEFGTLLDSFNAMSDSLKDNDKRIGGFIRALDNLNNAVLDLHSATSVDGIVGRLSRSIPHLQKSEEYGFAFEQSADVWQAWVHCRGKTPREERCLEIDPARFRSAHDTHHGEILMLNRASNGDWPIGTRTGAPLRNLAIAWMKNEGRLIGAIFTANMDGEGIPAESTRLLQILARNSAVALERIRLTESLREHVEDLQNTRQQLTAAEKLTAVGSLTCGIAHDFNNVLCGMIGQLQLLKSAPLSAEIRKRLDTVEGAAGRAAELTSGLLAFSRSQTHRMEALDLDERIRNVVDLLNVTFDKRITLELALHASGEPVLADAGQLDQVILNLVTNARDAMDDGGTLKVTSEIVETERVPLAIDPAKQPRSWVRLRVEDDGVGMSEEVVSRVFEPFYTTKKRGTGLGLSVLKTIVDDHGGACRVESEVGQGTRFEVFLPTTDRQPAAVAGLATTRCAAGERVLVVDDEDAIQDFMAAALETLGYTTHTACDGREAIAVVERLGDELDLVLLDVDMPVMGGREACKELKRIRPDLKIVLTTGWMFSDEDMEEIVDATDGLLQKPFSLTTLCAKVAEVLTTPATESRETSTIGQRGT